MYKEVGFDENKPSKDNIEYVLSKILYCLTSAKFFEEYKNYKERIDEVLDELIKAIDIFINKSDLLTIPYIMLDSIAVRIDCLDHETINYNGMYLEMANVWMSILIGYYDILKKGDYFGKR